MKSRSASLVGRYHRLTVYDADKPGGPHPYDGPVGDQLAYSAPGELDGQIMLHTAAEHLPTTVTAEMGPADHQDAQVAWRGPVQMFSDRLALLNHDTEMEGLGGIGLSAGVWQVTVSVSGRDEAIHADAARRAAMLEDDFDFEHDLPPSPEKW